MEQKAIQWVGSPSCLRGSYAFYKSVSCRAENGGPPQVWKLGEFYYARCGPQEPVCIAEVTLLWEDLSQRHLLASSRLYFLPEDTPKGRTREHGEDEVLAVSKKVVVRVDDLVKWARVEPAEWKKDPSGTNGLHKPPLNNITICTPCSTPENTTTTSSPTSSSSSSSTQNSPPEPSTTVSSVRDDTSEDPEDETEISALVAEDSPAAQPCVSHCAADLQTAQPVVSHCAADRPAAEHAASLCAEEEHPAVASSCGHVRSHDAAVIAAGDRPVSHCVVADRPVAEEHAVSLCVALELPVVKVLSYPQYCRFRSLQRRIQDGGGGGDAGLQDPHLLALGAIRLALPSTRILFCRDTFSHPSLDNNTSLWAQIRCPPLSLRGRPRKRRGRYSRDSPTSSGQSESWIERMKENVLGSVEMNNSEEDDWLPHPEEQLFLEQLYTYMDCHSSPIHKVPNLGFKRINLFLMYSVVKRLGGYDKVTSDRLWKVVYNELGGCPGSTSAATCTRRHYERLILPYEKHLEAGGAELQIPESLAVPRTRAVGRGRKPMARGRKPRIKAREKSLTPPLPAAAPLSPSLPHPPPPPPPPPPPMVGGSPTGGPNQVGASPPDGPAAAATAAVVVKRGRGRPPGRRNKATLLAQAKLLAQQHAQATKVVSPPPQQQHGQAKLVSPPQQQRVHATKLVSPPQQQRGHVAKVVSPPQQRGHVTKLVSSPKPTANQTLLVFPPLLAGGRPQQQQQQHIKQLKAPQQPQLSVCPQTHVVYAGINLNGMPLTPELSPMSAPLVLPFQPKLGKESQPQEEAVGDSLKQQGRASPPPPSAPPRHPAASSGGSPGGGGGGFSPTKGMCPLDVFRTRLGLHRPPPPSENPDTLTPQSSATARPPAPILHHHQQHHHHPLQTKVGGGGPVDTPLPGGDLHHHQCSGCSEHEASSQPRGGSFRGEGGNKSLRPPLPPLRVLPLDLDCSVHVRQLMRTRLGSTQLQSFTRRLSEVLSQDLKPGAAAAAAPLSMPPPPAGAAAAVVVPCSPPVTPPPEQAAPLNLSMRTPPPLAAGGAAKRTCSDDDDDDTDPSTDEPSAKKPRRVCPSSSEQAEAEDLSLGGRSSSASGRLGGGGGGGTIKSQQEEPADLSSPVRLRAFLLGLPPFHIKVEEKDPSEAPPSPPSWGKPSSLLLPHPVPLLLLPPPPSAAAETKKTTEVRDDQNQAVTVKTEPCLPTTAAEVEPSPSAGCGGGGGGGRDLGKTEGVVPVRVETLKAEDVVDVVERDDEREDETREAREEEEETSEPRDDDAMDQDGDFGEEGREEPPDDDDEKMECDDVEALTNGLPSAAIPQPTALPLAQQS